MLNELYQLSLSLKRCGIAFEPQIQEVKSPGKADGFIIEINGNGKPENIEFISAVNMSKLWTIRKGNHNSFPFIKLKKPLIKKEIEDGIWDNLKDIKTKKKEREIYLSILKELCDQEVFHQQEFISEWARNKILPLKEKNDGIASLIDLLSRIPDESDKRDAFVRALLKLINDSLNKILNGNFPEKETNKKLDLIESLLVGKLKKEGKENKIVCDVPVFFDVSDWTKYYCRVASPDMGKLVSNNLSEEEEEHLIQVSALEGGPPKEIRTGPYPDINLPVIGRTYLFSMNEQIPCHGRYGMIGSKIFPSSKSVIDAADGALRWSVAEERKGKTWQAVPGNKKKPDLLITYLEDLPEAAIDLASIFSTYEAENQMSEAVFENKTEMVCKALKVEQGLSYDSRINVIVIRKVDEGRAQAVLNNTYTVRNIVDSLENWRKASANSPPFSTLLPGKKGEKALKLDVACPSPVDLMKCYQRQWIKSGLDRRDAPGVSLQQIYDLYLGNQFVSKQAARMLLNLALLRLCDLFIGYGGADHSNTIREKKYSVEARRSVLHGISILAIALYKSGITKEEYMKNAAFNVGRMLALADRLHEQYCRLVRKSEVPPQLIGNALMHTALDNPTKGLSLLSERLLIYQAWATKVQGEEYKLAKWVLGEMGRVTAELENAVIPLQSDDTIKAQVLLGYLAHFKNEN